MKLTIFAATALLALAWAKKKHSPKPTSYSEVKTTVPVCNARNARFNTWPSYFWLRPTFIKGPEIYLPIALASPSKNGRLVCSARIEDSAYLSKVYLTNGQLTMNALEDRPVDRKRTCRMVKSFYGGQYDNFECLETPTGLERSSNQTWQIRQICLSDARMYVVEPVYPEWTPGDVLHLDLNWNGTEAIQICTKTFNPEGDCDIKRRHNREIVLGVHEWTMDADHAYQEAEQKLRENGLLN
ncbi:hypothetical protein EG329_008974 [Mollisiaceae sp. DMI_Dod_QoI]|nr:hypothetical protein EG329_008974 [Helotiales sp. DMI_Dod_QoI]